MLFSKQTLLVSLGLAFGIHSSAALGQNVYWTDRNAHKVQRACQNGLNVQDIISTGLVYPRGIALDLAGGKLYWTYAETGNAKVQRANLDGSNIEDLVTTGLGYPSWMALDVSAGKMYWTDRVSPGPGAVY